MIEETNIDGKSVKLIIANKVEEDSWLHEERFKWFLEGYYYATTQSRAIPTLAQIHPEELYFAVSAILRGVRRAGIELPK